MFQIVCYVFVGVTGHEGSLVVGNHCHIASLRIEQRFL